jgi:hypothetical protein
MIPDALSVVDWDADGLRALLRSGRRGRERESQQELGGGLHDNLTRRKIKANVIGQKKTAA